MSNKFLYVTGCSFTAGTELYDNTIPNFPGLINFQTVIKRSLDESIKSGTEWLTYRANYLGNLEISEAIKFSKIEKSLSWANILADYKSIPIYNDAVAGSSNEGMLHRTVLRLAELRKMDIVPTRAMIQIITPYRINLYRFKKHIDTYYNINELFDHAMFLNGLGSDVNKNLGIEFLKQEGEEGLLLRNLTAIATLREFLLRSTGKPPIMIDPVNNLDAYNQLIGNVMNKIGNEEKKQLELLIELCGFNEKIYSIGSYVESYMSNEYTSSPGNHYSPLVNERFGKFLAEQIGDEL
jgi:cyanate lyase